MKRHKIKALLLIAHGSGNQDSNDEIHALTRLLRTSFSTRPKNSLDEKFAFVDCAFLELTDPDIATAIDSLVREGVTEITVLPYFLAKGNHINKDIPAKISVTQIRFPSITVNSIPHIGKAADMPDLLIRHLQDYTR
ncbi:sirohydrochlorin chelatase [Candidatus Spongiihabitans sp.]|uniref:sirohydrochlorin chelatase n=1 Tax=Candidatus Spongiihabitans sp. TaxID=3101308 RepID=UPI003C6F3BB7